MGSQCAHVIKSVVCTYDGHSLQGAPSPKPPHAVWQTQLGHSVASGARVPMNGAVERQPIDGWVHLLLLKLFPCCSSRAPCVRAFPSWLHFFGSCPAIFEFASTLRFLYDGCNGRPPLLKVDIMLYISSVTKNISWSLVVALPWHEPWHEAAASSALWTSPAALHCGPALLCCGPAQAVNALSSVVGRHGQSLSTITCPTCAGPALV